MDNKALLAQLGNVLNKMGIPDVTGKISKSTGVITTEGENFGGLMPRAAVMDMINLTYKRNAWLQRLNNVGTNFRTGHVPVFDLAQNVSEGVGMDNDNVQVRAKPQTSNVAYSCKKFKADWSIGVDQLRDAEALGLSDFYQTVTAAFADAIGNDKANIIMNGNTALGTTTSLDRMLRMVSGLGVKAESANVYDAAGKAFGKGLFDAMLQKMPEPYRSDPDITWLYDSLVDAKWREKLTAVVTGLGDRALTNVSVEPPLGRQPLIVPQISDVQGPTAIAPTSAADKTTYIELVLTTLVTALHVATAAAGVSRMFKVTCKTTGLSEVCVGYLDTTLRIITAGLLGQTTVSATASDYEVRLYDETDIYLTNPKMITVVDCYEMKSYSEFNKDFDRWDIVTYYYLDVLIPVLAAIVKFKRIGVTPTLTW